MATEKDLKNQVKKLGGVISDKDKELKGLKNIAEELGKQKEANAKVEGSLKNLQIQHDTIAKQNREFRKTIEDFNPELSKKLGEDLETKKTELSSSETTVKQLRKDNEELLKKNQKLVDGDESNTGLLEDIKIQKNKIETLQKEKEALEKKVARTEGEFPKLPVPNSAIKTVEFIAEVQLNKDQKRQAYRIEMKRDPGNYLLQITVDADGSHDADFSQLK